MNDDEVIEASVDLRRKLFEYLKEFWMSHKNVTQEQMFFINSVVMASLISQIVYAMFQKDIGKKPLFDYIDKICNIAKDQLLDAEFLMSVGIQ